MTATLNLTVKSDAIARRNRDALVQRLLKSVGGVFDVYTVHIGNRLGLYRALSERGPLTSVELADATGTQERYVREWLEQQATVGILEAINPEAPPRQRQFRLPPGHDEVLVDTESLDYMAPAAALAVGAARPIERVIECFRTGGGVSYADYGQDLLDGQGSMNRAMFLKLLGSEWLPAVTDVHERLSANPPARIADFGCGVGWSSIGIAQAYPNARVDGFDLDPASIELAKRNVAEAGLADRVTMQCRDAGDASLAGQYDLVTAFECVHDMGNPVAALATMRRLVGERGTVIVADERVGERFGQPSEVEWMMYGWSVLHCLPVGMADGAEHCCGGTGTVMRPDTLRKYARDAGFRDVEVLPIDNFFFRFYRLKV